MNTFSLLQGAATSEAWGVFALVIALQLAFYGTIAVHIALSFSRALITLGLLGSRETQKRLDRLVCASCAAAMLAAAVIVVRGQLSMFLTN